MEIEASAVFSIIYPMNTYLQYEWHFLSQNCHGPGEKVLDEMQKAIVTITHDMEFVADNYERVIVMCQKKIIADGRTKNVFFQKEIMEKAMLKQPALVRIATEIGMRENTLDVKAVAAYIRQNAK